MKKWIGLIAVLMLLIGPAYAAPPSSSPGIVIKADCSGVKQNGSACWNGSALCVGNGISCISVGGSITGLTNPLGADLLGAGYNLGSAASPLGDAILGNGKALKTDTTAAHTLSISGYGSTGSAYQPVITVANSTVAKLGFFSTTPVAQQTGDVKTGLGNLGLIATPTIDADTLGGHAAAYFQTALTNPTTGTGTQYYTTYWTGSGTLGSVAPGTADYVLTSNGASAAPSYKPSPSGMVYPAAGVPVSVSGTSWSGTSLNATNLGTFAGIAPSANIVSLLGSADYATARTNLGLAIGTDVQAYSGMLKSIADIADQNADILLIWDDTDGAYKPASLGSGITYSHALHQLSTSSSDPDFSKIGGGTNTTAAMTVGAGSSLTYASSGTITASHLGASAAASYALKNASNFTLTSQSAGDILYADGTTSYARLGKGTALQILNMNAGDTAPAWTSTLGATATRLTKIWTTDLEISNLPTVGGTSIHTSPAFNTDIHAASAGGATVGTNALPFSGVRIGAEATKNILLTGTSSGDVTVTLPQITSTLSTLGANTYTGGQTLSAGTTAAGTAPLYFTDGNLLTTPVNGAFEYKSPYYYTTANNIRDYLMVGASPLKFTTGTTTGRLITLEDKSQTLLNSTATGVQTFLTTPSSANFASMITDETGTGLVTLATSPAFTTDIHSTTFGTATLGTATRPFGDTIYFGGSGGTYYLGLAGTAGASNKTITLPNATGNVQVVVTNSTSARQMLQATTTSGIAAYSTATWADPGTSGNMFQSDGTNWTSTATPALPTGTTGTTQTVGDNSTKIATTAFVATGLALGPTLAGSNTFTGNNVYGDADTDTLTVRSMIIGGNSREVQINAGTRTAPTYPSAAPTQDLYVKGNIETPAAIYAASFNTGTGTDGQRALTLNSNTALTPSGDMVYYVNDVLFWSENSSVKSPMKLSDTQTATGAKTFTGGLYSGNTSTASDFRIYNNAHYIRLGAPAALAADKTWYLPAADGTNGQALTTDGSGNFSFTSVTAAAGGSNTQIQYNNSTAIAGAADFTRTSAGVVQIGVSGTAGSLVLYNNAASYKTTLVATAGGQSSDITITMPSTNSTLLGSGANTFTGSQTLRAGTTSAGTAPLYFGTTSPTLMTTAEAGAMEYNGTSFFLSPSTTRYSIPLAGAAAPLTFTTGGTTARTITFPDAAITVARTDAANSFTGIQTFLGNVVHTPAVRTTSAAASPYLTINTPADTAITASTESPGVSLVTASRQWATGALTLQREVLLAGPTYTAVGASTFTDTATLGITPPVQGANVTITRNHSLAIVDATSAASSVTGGFVVATALGTAATSVGIGGGNVNAGGSVTAGGAALAGGTNTLSLTNGTAAVTLTGGTNVFTLTNGSGVITSPTAGTATLVAGTMLASGGSLPSLTPVIDDPDNFAANFTGANLYGGTFICNAAGTAALPAVAAGMNFTIIVETTGQVIINPDSTGTADTIVMNGLAAAQDENIQTPSTAVIGSMCVFQYRAADSWMATCNGFTEATPP